MNITKTPLGKHLYLYRQATQTTSVTISAHGGYRPSTRAFDLRDVRKLNGAPLNGMNVFFFKRHGFASSQKLENGLGQSVHDFEKYTISDQPGQGGNSVIVNYELFKYHEDDEDRIHSVMKRIHADRQQDSSIPVRDLITIRNRTFGDTVTLEKVVRKAANQGYQDIYCLFCRSQMESNAIKFEGMRPLDPTIGPDDTRFKMVRDNDFKTWSRYSPAEFGK